MRVTAAMIGLAAFAWAHAASAQTLTPASFSPEFEEALHEDYGVREGAYLRESVARAISAALARRGVSPSAAVQIDVSIVDAQPNRPTFAQLRHRPGLDASRSLSIGGATLHAVLRSSDGQTLAEVDHRYYTRNLREAIYSLTTWSDAHRSIRRFAEKVADAYAAQAR